MKSLLRILLPLSIVVGAFLFAWYLIASQPEAKTYAVPPEVTRVEATRLKPQNFQVYLRTQGTVRPRTTSTLIPEVSGRIVEISPNFREGGFFSEGEVLLKIDPLNYETAIVVAESSVASARTLLSEEEIRGQQALENWRRLGKTGEPSELVARKPQLEQARAQLRAAEAEVVQARRDLERTLIRAPYHGRILTQSVDVGQFVSTGTTLARAFATDVMEVRLPLTNQQLSFVDLPKASLQENAAAESGPEVRLEGGFGSLHGEWTGKIVRVDSTIDEASRQLFVVAEVNDPYRRRGGAVEEEAEMKIGMFVDGMVQGKELQGVFVLPRRSVRVDSEVIVIGADNRIRRQKVEPIWSEAEQVVIPSSGAGLAVGDVVCLTPLSYPANGALVQATIDGIAPAVEQPEGKRPPGTSRPGEKGGKS